MKNWYGCIGFVSLLGVWGALAGEPLFYPFFAFLVFFEYFWVTPDEMFLDTMKKCAATAFFCNLFLTAAATLGCYCSLTFNKMYPVAMDNKNIYATIGGALTILLLTMWNKKRKAKWVSNWSATLAMIVGLVFACIV